MEAYRAALRAGLTDAQFWVSTPYLTRLKLEAHADNQRDGYRLALWTAWHTAAFARPKRMPGLSGLLRGIDRAGRAPQRMTEAEMVQRIEIINAALGGADLRVKKPPHLNN